MLSPNHKGDWESKYPGRFSFCGGRRALPFTKTVNIGKGSQKYELWERRSVSEQSITVTKARHNWLTSALLFLCICAQTSACCKRKPPHLIDGTHNSWPQPQMSSRHCQTILHFPSKFNFLLSEIRLGKKNFPLPFEILLVDLRTKWL